MQDSKLIGTIGEIWRYPVKSMLGELLGSVQIKPRGIVGDRICAFRDQETGKVVSAKLPHKWNKLLSCQATFNGGTVNIRFPDGAEITAEKAAGDLSEMLGRKVSILFDRTDGLQVDRADPDAVREHGSSNAVDHSVMPVGLGAPEGGFFDACPIHFVTDASVAKVADSSADGANEAARFRPNIVINALSQVPFEENSWVGASLRIGETLRLAVLFPTPRCAVPTLAHGHLKPDYQIVHRVG